MDANDHASAYSRMDDALDRLERVVLPPLSTSSAATAVSNADGKTENMKMIKTAPERTRLMEVLLGMAPLSPPKKREKIDFFDHTLNDSQKAAVVFALEAPELACIHGPPGQCYDLN
jgi:DNA polymerase alpha-associated DNA helicase A